MPVLGPEKNILFEEDKSGGGKLNVVKEIVVQPGDILKLPPDAIHCIENITDEPARALHTYGGNFKTLDDERALWSWKTKEKVSGSCSVFTVCEQQTKCLSNNSIVSLRRSHSACLELCKSL